MKPSLTVVLALLMIGCGASEQEQTIEEEVDRCGRTSSSASNVLWTEMCALVEATCGGSTHIATLQSSTVRVEADDTVWTEHVFADETGNTVTAGETCGSALVDGCGQAVGSCLLRESDIGDRLLVVLSNDAQYGGTPALYASYRGVDEGPIVDPNGDATVFATPEEFQEAWSLREQERPESAACDGSGDVGEWCSSPLEIYE
jgi:hypothetical protein